MPRTTSDLDLLRQQLRRTLAGRPQADTVLFAETGNARLHALIRAIGPARGHRHVPHLAHGVMTFRLRRRETPCPELKYACYGIARQVDWEGRRLIDDARMVADLLAAVAALPPGTRPFRDCCRALRFAWQAAAPERAADNGERWRSLCEGGVHSDSVRTEKPKVRTQPKPLSRRACRRVALFSRGPEKMAGNAQKTPSNDFEIDTSGQITACI